MPEGFAPYSHRGTRAIQRMVEFAPSTGGLALWVRHQDVPADADAAADADTDVVAGGLAAANALPVVTDGVTIYYGTAFEKLPIAEQVGLVAHEVLHIALRHPQRYLDLVQLLGDVDLQLFNICADAIVNSALSHLSWLKLPASAAYLDRLLRIALSIDQTVEKSLLEWDVERLYRAIDDRRMSGARGKRQDRREAGTGAGGRDGGSGSLEPRPDGPKSGQVRALGADKDADLTPRPGADSAPEAEGEAARTWSERLLRAHAGDGAHSMLRALLADLPRTRTPWEHVLRTQLARSLAPKVDISWSRPARSYLANQGRAGPHRRLPWTPGVSSSKAVPHLVVIVDVSGSINDDLMERFAREIETITRRQEAALVLIVGDDAVRRVEHFEPGRADFRDIKFAGGGGTDFTPLLEEADRHRPDIAVVLTDLEGPTRFRPRWPVIWAVPESHATAVQPFGRLVSLR